MDIIQNKDNSLVKEIRKLKEKKYRVQKEQFLVEGFRFCEEALKSDFEVPFLFVSEDSLDKFKKFKIEDNITKDTKVIWVKDSVLNTITSTENPQGIVGVVKNKPINLETKDGFYVLADKVQDPGNLGTIIRSAHASGALGVILTKGTVDVYNEKTLRSTMGSIFHVPVIIDLELEKIKELKKNGFKLLVSSLAAEEDFYEVDLKGRIIITVGNEGNGVSEEIALLGDCLYKIPMPGGAESLNVAVAASIMMFEALRQRK